MWTLEQVRAEYRRLDRLLGIDTSGIPVRFSKRMTRQYGVCTFLKNRPQEIRLADFLRQEDAVFWDTARHEPRRCSPANGTDTTRSGGPSAAGSAARRTGWPRSARRPRKTGSASPRHAACMW